MQQFIHIGRVQIPHGRNPEDIVGELALTGIDNEAGLLEMVV